jgi:hypothetical protein
MTSKPWRTGKVSDFFELQRGFDLTNKKAKEGHIPVISSSGISYYHDEAKWNESKKSDDLPLFSRISLMRSLKSLKLMSVEAAVCFINDASQKKQGKKKKRNKKGQPNA